jgi:CHAT domain-containing protein/tetratricopeptide (TPR) repeat protein
MHVQDLLSLEYDLFRPDAVEQLAEAVRSLLRVNVDHALNLAEVAMLVAAQLRDSRSLGLSARSKGNALWFRNELAAASELFTAAVTHFEEAGQPEEVGRTLSSSIQALVLRGEYTRALAAADKAREIFRSLEDYRRLARLEINIANLHHRQDRFAEALACYESAYRQLLPYKDAEGIGVALHNMSVCLIMLDDFQTALETFQAARGICEENSMPLLTLQSEYNIAYLYFLRGEYRTALRGLRRVRESCQVNGDKYHHALCHLDESEILLELNLVGPAAQMAKQAMYEFEDLGMRFEQGRSAANLASASHRLHNSSKALELLRISRQIFGDEGNQAWMALIALYESIVLLECGAVKDARSACRTAIKIFSIAGLRRRQILAELVLIRTLLAASELTAACRLCQKTQRRLAKINAPLLSFQSHLLMGRILQASGEEHAAYASYECARKELESLRNWVQGDELKVAFMGDKAELYSHLVQLSMRTEEGFGQAFAHMEQAKSRALADLLLSGLQPGGTREQDTNEQSALDAIRNDLNWYYHRLDLEQNPKENFAPSRIGELYAKIQSRENQFLQAIRDSELENLKVRSLASGDPVTLSSIRSVLGPEMTLIEYFEIEESFVAAVITIDSITIVTLAEVSAVAESLQMLEFQMARMRVPDFAVGNTVDRLTEMTVRRLRELYDQIFAPLSPHVRTENCIIVPHGLLHYIPFHALATADDYLVDRYAISYAPSASLYAACESRIGNNSGSSLLLGVPDAMAPSIRQEIESIASVVPEPRIFIGENATSDVLRAEGPSARLIHLATHGVARHDSPLFSTIRLADRYITLHDLYRFHLPVQLITLSGCATGVSAVAAGDELQGLTRGLLYSGAASILVTLWDVQDHTTAEFIHELYSNLFLNRDKGYALQQSMVQFRTRYPHPFHWAPFIVIGSRAGMAR